MLRTIAASAALSLLVFACGSSSGGTGGGTGAETDGGPGTGTTTDGGGTGTDTDGGGPPILAGDGGGVPITYTSAVSIIVEPSDNGAALLAAVKAAKKSVHVTMYMFTDTALETALADQKKAGRDVQIVLNQTFPAGQGNSNSTAYSYFTGKGIPTHYAPTTFQFTHAKVFIIDGTDAWIMTMNTTQSSATNNREFLALDTDPADVADAEKIFAGDFANSQPPKFVSKLMISPWNTSTIDARTRMISLINTATKTIDVAAEELADKYIANAIIARAKAGVQVKIVVSGSSTPSPTQVTTVASLKAAGIVVKALSTPDIHAKAIIVDDARAYVGSQNFTDTSMSFNRELGVLTDNATEIAKMGTALDGDYAAGVAQ